MIIITKTTYSWGAVAQWLELRTGDRGVLVRIMAEQLRNFGNSIYPTLPLSFGGDTKSHRSLLSGDYATILKLNHSEETPLVIGRYFNRSR